MNSLERRVAHLEDLFGPPNLDIMLERVAREDGLSAAELEELRASVLDDLQACQGMSPRQIVEFIAARDGISADELLAESERLQKMCGP